MSKLQSGQSTFLMGPLTSNIDNVQDSTNWYRVGATYGYMYTDLLWPRSRIIGGPIILDSAAIIYNFWFWSQERVGGTQTRIQVTGQVQYANGTAVSAATVNLFDTPTGTIVDTTTTDNSGYYTVGSPYNTNVFAIGYLSGSPDQMGTTINTIPG